MGTKDHWAYHEGKDADERMTAAAKKRNIHLTSKSRPLVPEDFQRFDMIIGMDFENSLEIKKAAQHWKEDLQKPIPTDYQNKARLVNDIRHQTMLCFESSCSCFSHAYSNIHHQNQQPVGS